MGKGWKGDPVRHGPNPKGIRSTNGFFQSEPKLFDPKTAWSGPEYGRTILGLPRKWKSQMNSTIGSFDYIPMVHESGWISVKTLHNQLYDQIIGLSDSGIEFLQKEATMHPWIHAPSRSGKGRIYEIDWDLWNMIIGPRFKVFPGTPEEFLKITEITTKKVIDFISRDLELEMMRLEDEPDWFFRDARIALNEFIIYNDLFYFPRSDRKIDYERDTKKNNTARITKRFEWQLRRSLTHTTDWLYLFCDIDNSVFTQATDTEIELFSHETDDSIASTLQDTITGCEKFFDEITTEVTGDA